MFFRLLHVEKTFTTDRHMEVESESGGMEQAPFFEVSSCLLEHYWGESSASSCIVGGKFVAVIAVQNA